MSRELGYLADSKTVLDDQDLGKVPSLSLLMTTLTTF